MKKSVDTKSIISVLILSFVTLKMMLLPSLTSTSVGRSTFVFVFLMYVLEIIVAAILMKIAMNTGKPFAEVLTDTFGKVIAKIILTIYFLYFLINTISVIESLFVYLSEHLYLEYEWWQYIVPLFLMLMFVAGSDFKGIVRTVQFVIPFVIMCVLLATFLSITSCDFSNCLPFFEGGVERGLNIFNYAFWFGDGLIILMFFGKVDKTRSLKPIVTTTLITSIIVTFFFFIFFCIFESDTLNNKEAIVDILKVLPQNSDVGNINWIITVMWQVALLVYICLYTYITRMFLEELFSFDKARISIPIVLALCLAGLLAINFDVNSFLLIATEYIKYFAIVCQYILPAVVAIGVALKRRKKYEKSTC